jgi:hypothetical protein
LEDPCDIVRFETEIKVLMVTTRLIAFVVDFDYSRGVNVWLCIEFLHSEPGI